MMRRLVFLLAILPGASLADPDTQTPAATIVPVGSGRPHSCVENYPEAAVKAGIEGATTLSFTVTAQGKVADVKVSKSSGNAELDAAAVACAGQWTYRPATQDGVAIDRPWTANVQWKLHGDDAASRLTPLCTSYHPLTEQLLSGIGGVTRLTLRLMPDGSVTQAAIVGSSGDATLDDAAQRCAGAQRVDLVGVAPPPPEGVLLSTAIDWPAQLRSSVPIAPPFPDGLTLPRAIGRHGPCSRVLGFRPNTNSVGPTTVRFTVTNEGNVQDGAVQQSSGSHELDKGALSCTAGWHYWPASRNGTPQAVQWVAKVDWHER